jgi:hypothetical protein
MLLFIMEQTHKNFKIRDSMLGHKFGEIYNHKKNWIKYSIQMRRKNENDKWIKNTFKSNKY